MEKTDIKSLNLEELTAFVESLGEKKFRAKQIYEWMHRKHVASFSDSFLQLFVFQYLRV